MAETPDRLAEIEARANAATRGPWLQTRDISTGVKIWPSEHGSHAIFQVLGGGAYSRVSDADPVPQWQKNADFVRCAREDVPYLLTAVRSLTDERDRLIKTLEVEGSALAVERDRTRALQAEVERLTSDDAKRLEWLGEHLNTEELTQLSDGTWRLGYYDRAEWFESKGASLRSAIDEAMAGQWWDVTVDYLALNDAEEPVCRAVEEIRARTDADAIERAEEIVRKRCGNACEIRESRSALSSGAASPSPTKTE